MTKQSTNDIPNLYLQLLDEMIRHDERDLLPPHEQRFFRLQQYLSESFAGQSDEEIENSTR